METNSSNYKIILALFLVFVISCSPQVSTEESSLPLMIPTPRNVRVTPSPTSLPAPHPGKIIWEETIAFYDNYLYADQEHIFSVIYGNPLNENNWVEYTLEEITFSAPRNFIILDDSFIYSNGREWSFSSHFDFTIVSPDWILNKQIIHLGLEHSYTSAIGIRIHENPDRYNTKDFINFSNWERFERNIYWERPDKEACEINYISNRCKPGKEHIIENHDFFPETDVLITYYCGWECGSVRAYIARGNKFIEVSMVQLGETGWFPYESQIKIVEIMANSIK